MNRQHLLCVDDEPLVLQSIRREIKQEPFFSDFTVDVVDSGPKALSLIDDILADGDMIPVILSDQRMPVMNGDAFIIEARKRSAETLAVLLTGFSDLNAVVNLVNQNALYRYLSKPWDRNDLIMTIKEAVLTWKRERIIQEQNRKIEFLTMAMVTALESANYYFDEETDNHVRRIALLSEFIARSAGVDNAFVKSIKLYAPLHDIGKIGVDKSILLKPGKLTADEYEQMKKHTTIGFRIIENDIIDQMAKNIVLYHHEKWAGTGYPERLGKENIPLEARIVSLADVYDALVSERAYKAAYSVEDALGIIENEKGVSFDPALAEAFLSNMRSLPPSRKYPFELEDG